MISVSIIATRKERLRHRVRSDVEFRWEGKKKDSRMNQRFAWILRSNRLHALLPPTKYIIARGDVI